MDPTIRRIAPAEAEDVIAILDAAMLAFDREYVRRRAGSADVLVAELDDRLVGAMVLEGESIDAIAVRPRYRHRGIGSALLERAKQERTRLIAECDDAIVRFYLANGFTVIDRDGDRVTLTCD